MDRIRLRIVAPLALIALMYVVAFSAIFLSNQKLMYALYISPASILLISIIDISTSKNSRVIPVITSVAFLFLSIVSMMILVVGFGGV